MALLPKILFYRLLLSIAGVVFVLDQVTKAWVFNHLPYGAYHYPDSIRIVEGFFYIVHIDNDGAAWGLFSGYSGWLAVFAVVALLVIYRFRHTLELHRSSLQIAFGLLVGGILGNLIDRMIHGHVVDFIDLHFPFTIPVLMPTGRYPSFNIADCGIVVGTLLYVAISLLQPAPAAGNAEDKA